MTQGAKLLQESKENVKAKQKAAKTEQNQERNQKWLHRVEGSATVVVLLVTFLIGTKF